MPVIPLGPLREMSGSPNCLSMESISLILSEMNRFLRCSACLIVPRKHLWYIKPCLHSYCKDCLEAMEATCRCRSCERHFSPRKGPCHTSNLWGHHRHISRHQGSTRSFSGGGQSDLTDGVSEKAFLVGSVSIEDSFNVLFIKELLE
ncbi:BRCA1associated RING domain protein 1like [Caligus rogercresseyi]|uniref:BRCA1associated RING domain protein 1like n=1 Tax=Caligus rogercresseyi TaxID=217165 RepID=A0A7T8K0Y6_CALRO|nr:BRCA1associated RING domain protein 1like [Caligus rogercresseyi]